VKKFIEQIVIVHHMFGSRAKNSRFIKSAGGGWVHEKLTVKKRFTVFFIKQIVIVKIMSE
jgi:hypothetical protein